MGCVLLNSLWVFLKFWEYYLYMLWYANRVDFWCKTIEVLCWSGQYKILLKWDEFLPVIWIVNADCTRDWSNMWFWRIPWRRGLSVNLHSYARPSTRRLVQGTSSQRLCGTTLKDCSISRPLRPNLRLECLNECLRCQIESISHPAILRAMEFVTSQF